MLDSTALVSFVASPRGFLALVLASVTRLAIRLGEHVGLSAIVFGALDGRFVTRAHRRGQQVYAWTVDTAEDMEGLFDLGIDGIITNQSALARTTLSGSLDRQRLERAVRRVRAWLAG